MEQTSERTVCQFARALSVSVAIWAITSAPAVAGPILLNPGGGSNQVQFAEPVGQTFTAEDPLVSAGLYFLVMNPQFPNSDAIEYQLHQGSGTGGALLASTTFNLASGFDGFHMVDFSSVALTPGNVYTLTASIVGTSPYWGVAKSIDVYAGGVAVFFGVPEPGGEMALSVVPQAPEPASLFLIASAGLGLLIETKRRRKQRQ